MFRLAGYIGIYSYLIFLLGIINLLTVSNVQNITIFWIAAVLVYERKTVFQFFPMLKRLRYIKENNFIYLFVILFVLQAFVNLIGALGPELAFDALWYHLTLPKLYLLHKSLYEIQSSILYYGYMPKLGEMLYIGTLSFGNEIVAKMIHFIFGILTAFVLFNFSRKFFNRNIAIIIISIFYANLVVDWESITAYIDLFRTFFELLALFALINWFESEKNKWLVVSGLMMGLAITAKVLAFGSFFILLALVFSILIIKRKSLRDLLISTPIFVFSTLLVPLPWFIYSFIYTGNPVYPFFTRAYEISANSPNPLKIIPDLWELFTHSADPISPLYLLFLPLLFIFYSKLKKEIKIIVWYCGLSLILWYFTPRTGGGRFILPYLPAFSIVCGAIYFEILKKTRREWKCISNILFVVIILVSLISIGYRGIANKRFIPVIFGKESKQEFLTKNLNFQYGDFYDTDNYFSKHIKSTDIVLIYGFHNLYYMNFPFIDSTSARKGNQFNYIAVQKTKIPAKYANWQLIYSNDKTMVQLYKPPKGECQKLCQY